MADLFSPKLTQAEINNVVWRACDTFRGVVDPSQYKDYVLTMLFVKYLSDVWKERRAELLTKYGGDQQRAERAMRLERFVVAEHGTFDYLYQRRTAANLGELINIALEELEESNRAKLEGVFRNIDFNSDSALGQPRDRNARLKHLLEDFSVLDLRPSNLEGEDVIGNAYEYLIERFASDAGKKAGEFYTPKHVSELLARLMAPHAGERICDPTCGSGSLLIRMARQVGSRNVALYGQELNGSTYALCRMNMFLHGLDDAEIAWGDTLRNPQLLEGDRLRRFDVVVANPPFSLDKWGIEEAANDVHNRFWRGLPPKSRGDFAFISHMIETTYEGHGRVGVIVPHGVLFRGGGEGKIRQRLIEDNLLDAVIGLPANLFFGTGIPAAMLLFKRARPTTDVLFIDASGDFEPGKNQNRLSEAHMARVVAAYAAYENEVQYAHRATTDELRQNDFNLNIPRYVNTFEEEATVDLAATQREIDRLETQLEGVRAELRGYLSELKFI